MINLRIFFGLLCTCQLAFGLMAQTSIQSNTTLQGKVLGEHKQGLEFAQVYLKGSGYGTTTNQQGEFTLKAKAGLYILCVQMTGYKTVEKNIELKEQNKQLLFIQLHEQHTELNELTVSAKPMSKRIQESAYNVSAVDASALQNTNLDVAHALSNVTGVKVRETGGVGSQMQISVNGFSGKHVKLFVDGVPMEGMGSAFSMSNMPINLADRIEVYKGVVPIGLGSDALGGAINVVTKQKMQSYLDASYSYGSFNTHRSNVNAGYRSKKGFHVELNAFQNYSDNNYTISNAVKNLTNGQIDLSKPEKIKRFHDQYHSETGILKVGLVDQPFADRLLLSMNVSKNYKQLQNGVIQNVVFGQKFQRNQSYMPSLIYQKANVFTKGLHLNLTGNYNYNMRQNVDTATYEYNWRGEKRFTNKLGEQSYQDSKYGENNWNSTFGATYRLGDGHLLAINNVFTSFNRNTIQLGKEASTITPSDTMPKRADKNVLGISYRLSVSNRFNATAFVKHFYQYSIGPQQSSTSSSVYKLTSGSFDATGYGAAGTLFLSDIQVKLSYEQTYRLPTDTELFGDQDLERSSLGLKPEDSDNYNASISFEHLFAQKHFVLVDAGFVYRDVKNYISRVIESASNKYYATNINHGKVSNWGVSAEARYQYKKMIALGVNFSYQDIRDAQKYNQLGNVSASYNERIPNQPYFFASSDLNLFFNDLLQKGNHLTLTYGNHYAYEFPLHTASLGASRTKMMVPTQFSHDASATYSMLKGRYNLTLECRNLTNAMLYDNYSLQKPGRAFYLKMRYYVSHSTKK